MLCLLTPWRCCLRPFVPAARGPGAWSQRPSAPGKYGRSLHSPRRGRAGYHLGGCQSCRPLRPRSAHSPVFPGSRPATGGAQRPQPCPASAVQAEGSYVQQRPKPGHAHACCSHLTLDAHYAPSCRPCCPGPSSGHGGPADPAPRPAAAQEEPVPHGRYALAGLRAARRAVGPGLLPHRQREDRRWQAGPRPSCPHAPTPCRGSRCSLPRRCSRQPTKSRGPRRPSSWASWLAPEVRPCCWPGGGPGAQLG